MAKIEYKVELVTPAVTAKSGTIGKELDVTVKRNIDGQSYYSAKHIKGILKSKVMEFKNAFDEKYDAEKENNKKLKLDSEEFLEKYFGSADRISRLRFSDLILEVENDELEKELGYRYGVKIDRRTRTSEDNSLFNYEFVKPKNIYKGTIEIEKIEKMEKEDLKFILASLFHVDKIGGLKSRGIGKVEVKIEDKSIDKLDEIVDKCINRNNNKHEIKIEKYEKCNYELTFLEPIVLKGKSTKNEIEVRNTLQGSTIRGALIQYGIDKIGEENVDKLLEISVDGVIKHEYNEKTKECVEKIKLASMFETKYPIKDGKKKSVDKVIEDISEYTIKETREKIKLERGGLGVLSSTGSEISIKIAEHTRTTEEGMLFNTEYIDIKKEDREKTSFKGVVEGLPKGLFENDKEYELKIGKFKSKGFGKVKIKFSEYKEKLVTKEEIKKRINNLTNTMNRVNEELEKNNEKMKKDNEKYKNKKIITFDLLSDIVLPFNQVKNTGEEIKVLFGNELREKLELSMKKTFVNVEKLKGYSIVNNFRKNDEIIIKSGSVLTYLINENDLESVLERLVEIEIKGLGLRKNEGFGKVRICSKRERSS